MTRAVPFSRRIRCHQRGFTLLETAMAMVIIALAVAGMLQLLAAGTQSNLAASELTIGVNLTNNIREIASNLPYQDPTNPNSVNTTHGSISSATDIWGLNGANQSPPVDCRGQTIATYSNWTQKISVQTVSATNADLAQPVNNSSVPTARISVTILHLGKPVYQTSWMAVAPNS